MDKIRNPIPERSRQGGVNGGFSLEISIEFCDKVTKEKVVKGLKFIAEHRNMDQDQLIAKLIDLGCIFTFEDIEKQFPDEQSESDLAIGASIFSNYIYNRIGRSYTDSNYLSEDSDNDDESIYGLIRKLTGDNTYTKEYVDSLIKSHTTKNEKDINNEDIDKEDETRKALQKIISLLIKNNKCNYDCEIDWNGIILRSKDIKTPEDAYERIKTIAMLGTMVDEQISNYLGKGVKEQNLKQIITGIKKLAKVNRDWADKNHLNGPNIQNIIYL